MATLVYLYGPPAAGKLTIGELVAEATGFRLFHNHLTVNAVREIFPFRSPDFTEVLHRLRLDVFATAARTGTSLVFTNNSIWGGAGRGPRSPGRRRLASGARQARRRRPVAGDAGRPRPVTLHVDDLVVDTAALGPQAAADCVVAALDGR